MLCQKIILIAQPPAPIKDKILRVHNKGRVVECPTPERNVQCKEQHFKCQDGRVGKRVVAPARTGKWNDDLAVVGHTIAKGFFAFCARDLYYAAKSHIDKPLIHCGLYAFKHKAWAAAMQIALEPPFSRLKIRCRTDKKTSQMKGALQKDWVWKTASGTECYLLPTLNLPTLAHDIPFAAKNLG
jgi:hypothetical protein